MSNCLDHHFEKTPEKDLFKWMVASSIQMEMEESEDTSEGSVCERWIDFSKLTL